MPLTVNYGGVAQPDVADMYHGGDYYRCYVWANYETNEIGTACFVGLAQGQFEILWHRKMVSVGGKDSHYKPQVMATDDGEFILYFVTLATPSTHELQSAYIDVDTLSATPDWTLSAALAVDASELYSVEMIPGTSNWALAYENTSNQIVAQIRTSTVATLWSAIHTEDPVRSLGVHCYSATGTFLVSYEEAGLNRVRTHRRNASDGLGSATVTTLHTSGTEYNRLGHSYISATQTALVAECRFTSNPSDYRGVCCRKINNSNATPADTLQVTPWLTMLSRPFTWEPSNRTDNKTYVLVGFKSRMPAPDEWSQSHAFYVDLHNDRWANADVTATPVANAMLGDAVSVYADDNHLSHVCDHMPFGPALRTRTAAALRWSRITKEDGRITPNNPMVVGEQFYLHDPWLTLDGGLVRSGDDATFTDGPFPWTQFQNEPIGKGLAVCGGTPSIYDGAQFAEIGFSWWPEILSLTEGIGGSLPTTGTYSYTAVYEWTDNRGQMHRSAPALPVSITLTGANNVVAFLGINQTLTLKTHERYSGDHAVVVKVYRTTNGGSVYYAVTDYEAPVVSDTSFTWSNSDGVSDADLVNNELLPHQLQSGFWTPLENYQPPASNAIAVWNNRLWLATADGIWYSGEVLPDAGSPIQAAPEFHPVNVFRIDDGGEIVAMASMDYALAVFKADRIHLVYGNGNDRTGVGADLDSKRIGFGIGCVCARSVAVGRDGVFFQSEKGYYLLTRTEEVKYIGAGIEDKIRECGNVRSAVLHEDVHQLRLVAESTDQATQYCLVYDYLFDVWMYWELPYDSASGSRVVGGMQWRGYKTDDPIAVLRQSGDVLLERFDSTPYKDGNSPDLAETAITMEIGTQWLKLGAVDGWWRCKSILIHTQRKNTCKVTVKLAYDYKDFDPVDEYSVTLTEDEPIRVRPRIQKFAAIKIRVSDELEAGKAENISATAVVFEHRSKTGHRRVKDAQIAS